MRGAKRDSEVGLGLLLLLSLRLASYDRALTTEDRPPTMGSDY